MDSRQPQTLRALLDDRSPLSSRATGASVTEDNEYSPYANGRIGTRPQLTLVFHKADGSYKAFAYTHLFSVESANPDEGFCVSFSRIKVVVAGRNLNELQRLVWLQKAAEIVEAGQAASLQIPGHAPVVELIEFR